MVFQNYALYPHMTVYDNMAFGLKLRKVPKAIIDERVKEAAAILGIWLAAVQLLLYGEFAAAGIAALVSWGGAAADSLLRRS